MALIDCPECDHKISDQAATCPHCGFPLGAGTGLDPSSSKADARKSRTAEELFAKGPLPPQAAAGMAVLRRRHATLWHVVLRAAGFDEDVSGVYPGFLTQEAAVARATLEAFRNNRELGARLQDWRVRSVDRLYSDSLLPVPEDVPLDPKPSSRGVYVTLAVLLVVLVIVLSLIWNVTELL